MLENDKVEKYHPKAGKLTRAVFTVVVLLCYGFSEALLWFLSIFQFVWYIFKGSPNDFIIEFGSSLAKWNSQAVKYCLFIDDKAPFPFSSWPTVQKK